MQEQNTKELLQDVRSISGSSKTGKAQRPRCACHRISYLCHWYGHLSHYPSGQQTADQGIVYDSAAVEGGWDNLSPEEIAEKLNEKVAEGMINISMNTAPYFEDSTAEGNLMIVNESINNYPQKVQIVRNDTGEQIYESGAIAVGSKIEHAKLDAALPAGTYECTAYFHNLNPETGEIIGTAGAIINITIKN